MHWVGVGEGISGATIPSEAQIFRFESQLKPYELTDSGQSQSGECVQVNARRDAGACSWEFQ